MVVGLGAGEVLKLIILGILIVFLAIVGVALILSIPILWGLVLSRAPASKAGVAPMRRAGILAVALALVAVLALAPLAAADTTERYAGGQDVHFPGGSTAEYVQFGARVNQYNIDGGFVDPDKLIGAPDGQYAVANVGDYGHAQKQEATQFYFDLYVPQGATVSDVRVTLRYYMGSGTLGTGCPTGTRRIGIAHGHIAGQVLVHLRLDQVGEQAKQAGRHFRVPGFRGGSAERVRQRR